MWPTEVGMTRRHYRSRRAVASRRRDGMRSEKCGVDVFSIRAARHQTSRAICKAYIGFGGMLMKASVVTNRITEILNNAEWAALKS